MPKSDEMLRFEADLTADGKLRESFDAAVKRIAEAGEATSDGDALVKAAAELGYNLSMGELERLYADSQELSDEELDAISGGRDCICLADYYCFTLLRHNNETDPYNRQEKLACWSDYKCVIWEN